MTNKKHARVTTVESRKQLGIRLLLAVLFGYIFISLAIDSGSYWHYLATFVSVAIAVNAGGRLLKDIVFQHGTKRSN